MALLNRAPKWRYRFVFSNVFISLVMDNYTCPCLPWFNLDDFKEELIKKSPLDQLGYQTSCCFCCSVKVATVFICVVTFMWAAFEVTMAEKSLKNAFSNEIALQVLSLVYIFFSFLLMVAAGILMLGIYLEKSILVNLFVLYGLIYLCINTLLLIVCSSGGIIGNKGKMVLRIAIKLMFSVMWNCFFFYLLIIVNSYKSNLW